MDLNRSISPVTSKRRKNNLSDQERREIYEFLLQKSNDGKLKHGSYREVASLFSVSQRTVRRVWNQSKNQLSRGVPVDLSAKMIGKMGRKRIQINPSEVAQIPLRRRTTIRSLAFAMNVSRATLHRRVKEGFIRPHSNAIKPHLTEDNKRARLEYCLSMLDPDTFFFKDMFNVIHMDEKWFNMSKTTAKFYLAPDEVEPLRTAKSRRFIPKVMFLAVVARPRFDSSQNEIFSGKIGMFAFIFKEPAKRTSKNRPAGSMETKPILSITKDIIRTCLIEKVIPAIQEKWPTGSSGPIFIQQDNARPHIDCNDAEFLQAASSNGFDIRLTCQPPNSPDLNVLDLGFFRSIQGLQQEKAPATIDELVASVENSFDEYPAEKLNKVFLTHQMCMKEIMRVHGGMNYDNPHMNKDRLQREGILPLQLQCEPELVNNVLGYLEEQEH